MPYVTLDDKNYDPLRAKLTNSGRLHKVKLLTYTRKLKMLYDVENTKSKIKYIQTFEKLKIFKSKALYLKDEYEEEKVCQVL